MRRHIVWPLGDVLKKWVAVRNQARKKAFKVVEDILVGILRDEQRGTGMMNVQVAQPVVSVWETVSNRSADFIQSTAAGVQLDGFVYHLGHGSCSVQTFCTHHVAIIVFVP